MTRVRNHGRPNRQGGRKYGLEVTTKFEPSFLLYPHFTFMMITQLCYLGGTTFAGKFNWSKPKNEAQGFENQYVN